MEVSLKTEISSVEEAQMADLLVGYPYRQWQLERELINRNRLAQYALESIKRNICAGTGSLFLGIEQGEIAGFAFGQVKPWQSDVFGLTQVSVTHVLSKKESEDDYYSLWKSIVGFFSGKSCHITRRCAVESTQEYMILQKMGFSLKGASAKFYLSCKEEVFPVPTSKTRGMQDGDLSRVMEIASSHIGDCFHRDSHLSYEKSSQLFAQWVEKEYMKKSSCLFVGEVDNNLAGFIMLQVNKQIGKYVHARLGQVSLIVVDKKYRGKGVGKSLLSQGLVYLSENVDFIEVRTMVDNYVSQCLYVGSGFKPLACDLQYCKQV